MKDYKSAFLFFLGLLAISLFSMLIIYTILKCLAERRSTHEEITGQRNIYTPGNISSIKSIKSAKQKYLREDAETAKKEGIKGKEKAKLIAAQNVRYSDAATESMIETGYELEEEARSEFREDIDPLKIID